jgi:23S rRNA (cytosine1962-C5)-methyltransferase
MKTPTVAASPQGAKRLRSGNPWCYRTDILDAPNGLPPGTIVDVVDQQKNPIGQAFFATKSPLALRLLSRRPSRDEVIDRAFFENRFKLALARRRSLHGRDAFRVIHGEADLIPGLFVDQYGEALTIQTLSEGADARKAEWAPLLAELTGASVVVCRDDASGRDFELLPREKKVLHGTPVERVRYHEGPSVFEIDLLNDSKTGSFLDQVDNHLRAAELGGGEALDTFSYHGGFALALARTCSSVIAVEQDPVAAGRARANAEANGLRHVQVEAANAFDVMRQYSEAGRKFDVIVVDPPGLAKRREGMTAARRAYHELNVRALKLLRPEGLLVSCSCSGKVSRATFEEIVEGAAGDAKRSIQILERRGAGLDHPVLAGLGETDYLKAWLVRAL